MPISVQLINSLYNKNVACVPPTSGEALMLGMDKTTAAMNAKSRDVNDRLNRNFIEMFNVERIQIMSK